MEALFSNNGIILFLIACIAVITYTNFKENQRMFLLYLFAYGVAAFSIFRIRTSLLLLIISTFVFLEYLTDDIKKLELIVKFKYKICDYLYLMIFQYDFPIVFLSYLFLYFTKHTDLLIIRILCLFLSVLSLIWGVHRTISQPFKINTITETARIFDIYPPYLFHFDERIKRRFDLLCEFEDKSYFHRRNSYSCFSLEFLKFKFNNHNRKGFKSVLHLIHRIRPLVPTVTYSKMRFHIKGRGFSTPEMQLLRTIGISRGYELYKIRRKVYEVIYSKIIFSSLKDFHQANTHIELQHYKSYILSVYFRSVLTKIKGINYKPLSNVFLNSNDIADWSMDGLFIACLGLSFRPVNCYTLELFDDVIQKFDLNRERILELHEVFPSEKFPASDDR